MKRLIVLLILLCSFAYSQDHIRYKDLDEDALEHLVGSGFWFNAPALNNNISGYYSFVEDFIGADFDSSGTISTLSGWKVTGDATYDLLSAAGTLGGWMLIAPEAGSNNEVYLQLGELGTETYIEATASSDKKWWLEFNLTPSSVTNAANWFVGLAEEGSSAAEFINDSGADIADKDAILIGVFEGNTDSLLGIWQTAGAAFDTTFSTQLITAANMTIGIYFDGITNIHFYFNGSEIASQDISATGFPDTEELSPIIAMKQGATVININVDWIKLVAER